MLIDIHTHLKNPPHFALLDQVHFVGIHPWFIDESNIDFQKNEILKKVNNASVKLIGETGLDRLKAKSSIEVQIDLFCWHLSLARDLNLPLVVHCLKAHSDLLNILKNEKNVTKMLIHDFSGNEKELKQYLKFPVYFSFGKSLFREKSKAQNVFKHTPINRLFLETDDSDQYSLEEIYLQASKIKNELALEKEIEKNFLSFFNYPNDICPTNIIKNFGSGI